MGINEDKFAEEVEGMERPNAERARKAADSICKTINKGSPETEVNKLDSFIAKYVVVFSLILIARWSSHIEVPKWVWAPPSMVFVFFLGAVVVVPISSVWDSIVDKYWSK